MSLNTKAANPEGARGPPRRRGSGKEGAQGVARARRRGEPRPVDEVRKAAGLEGEAPAGGVWLWGVARPRGGAEETPKAVL